MKKTDEEIRKLIKDKDMDTADALEFLFDKMEYDLLTKADGTDVVKAIETSIVHLGKAILGIQNAASVSNIKLAESISKINISVPEPPARPRKWKFEFATDGFGNITGMTAEALE